MATQQSWAFRIGDGADPEVFTQLAGEYEAPEFDPENKSMRDATTIDVAQSSNTKLYVFNRQIDGQEFDIACDYDSEDVTHTRLVAQAGEDAAVNIQHEYIGPASTITWDFTCLVKYSFKGASSNDENAVDQVTFKFKIISDITETVV